MKKRFLELWRSARARTNPIPAFEKLERLYSETHRAYHNFEHIKNCLDEFSQVRHMLDCSGIAEFAIWYHDAVYDPRAKDNEEKSAELVYDTCLLACLFMPFAQRAKKLVLATKHNILPRTLDEAIIVDIDLSILGKSAEEFDEYDRSIRSEYSFVNEEQFRESRKTVLQGFLDRNTIYTTDFFRERYEEQARENLNRAIARLGI